MPEIREIRLSEYPTMSVEDLLAELDVLQPALTAAANLRNKYQKGSPERIAADEAWAPLCGAVSTIRRAMERSAKVDGGLKVYPKSKAA